MAEPLPRQEERGPAAIHLKENEKILLDGQQVYGTDGVAILNGRMEKEATLEDVSYPDRAGTAAPGTPVLLCDTKTGQRGLYEISRKEWLLEPSYDSLFYNNETKSFWGYRWAETEEKQRTFEITVNGGKITEKEMDLSAPYYVTEDSDGDCVLLDSQGECVFSKADLDPAFLSEVKAQTAPSGFGSIQVGSISGDGAWFEGFVGYETNHFIYDLKKKKLVSRLGDKIETYLSEADSAYTLTRNGKTAIYNALGGPLKAQNGHDFEYILGRDYYGYLENGRLIVEDIKGTVHYELETENRRLRRENIGYSIAKDTFFLMDEKEYSVWRKETCLMSGPMLSWWTSGEYVIVTAEDQKNIVLREKDGEIVYQSKLPEQILSISDAMLAVSRGNYFYLIDFDGEYALKLLDSRMGDD